MWGLGKPPKKQSSAVSSASDRSGKMNAKNWSPALVDDLARHSFGEIVGAKACLEWFQDRLGRTSWNHQYDSLFCEFVLQKEEKWDNPWNGEARQKGDVLR